MRFTGLSRWRLARPAHRPIRHFPRVWKDLHYRSGELHNAPMPYSVLLNGDEAFHEGNPPSAPMVAYASPAAARRFFYKTLYVGDVVQVVR